MDVTRLISHRLQKLLLHKSEPYVIYNQYFHITFGSVIMCKQGIKGYKFMCMACDFLTFIVLKAVPKPIGVCFCTPFEFKNLIQTGF